MRERECFEPLVLEILLRSRILVFGEGLGDALRRINSAREVVLGFMVGSGWRGEEFE